MNQENTKSEQYLEFGCESKRGFLFGMPGLEV